MGSKRRQKEDSAPPPPHPTPFPVPSVQDLVMYIIGLLHARTQQAGFWVCLGSVNMAVVVHQLVNSELKFVLDTDSC